MADAALLTDIDERLAAFPDSDAMYTADDVRELREMVRGVQERLVSWWSGPEKIIHNLEAFWDLCELAGCNPALDEVPA